MNRLLSIFAVLIILTTGCVSRKKYHAQVDQYTKLKADYDTTESNLQRCLSEKTAKADEADRLAKELADLKANSSTMLKQLSEMSVISASQSESIRKSLENINSKDSYIKNLQVEISRKDSMNLALVLNLKGALKDVNDEDVNIKVEGSAVFINISDKMLFRSGSYEITPRAKEVLGKVAAVVKAQSGMEFMVEGHTDNKAIATASIKDNWDLSVLRATAVVRILQKNYGVDPATMIAAGRSQYVPLGTNDSVEGRAVNRRTRIVILPQLDQFFKLMEMKN
ncbi:OmpA family protein [soil metagenome]